MTLAVSSPVIAAVQTVGTMAEAASNTSDPRMKALAAATAALAVKNAAAELAQADAANPAGISVSLTIGSSKSESNQTQSGTTAVGSQVVAGNDVRITATGAGQNSSLTVSGSDITAGHDATLQADGAITLQAVQSTYEQHSSNKSSSAGVGIAASIGQGGASFGITANASAARGNADGSDLTYTNTHIDAGNTVTLVSGADTTLKGAVVAGQQVIADIGGDLKIESLQDISTYTSQQQSAGGSVTIGAGFSGSASASKSNIDSTYASVVEQSGIQAGDGGYQVTVEGNTDLKGGVIASSQAAIDSGKNRFDGQGELTQSDIVNAAAYSAKSVSIGVGMGAGVGMGSESGSASSVTQAGIGVATEQDTTAAIAPIFDAQRVTQEINAQTAITQAFSREGSTAVGRYAADQLSIAQEQQAQAQQKQMQANAAQAQGDPVLAAQLGQEAAALQKNADDIRDLWGEQGTARLAAHALVGGLTGGLGGAAGAATASASTPLIDAEISKLDVSEPVRQALLQAATATLGAAVGGTAGAGAALAETANNYLTTKQEIQRDKELAACKTLACTAGTQLKYAAISAGQDAALLIGIGGGIGYQSAEQVAAVAEMVTHLPETLTALKAIVSDSQFQQQAGAAIVADYQKRIDTLTQAYNDGGFDGSITAGVEAGRLAVDVVTAGAAAVGAVKVVALTARAGAGVIAGNVARVGAEVPIAAKGTGDVVADAGSVKGVNPTGSMQNCTNCVAVVDNLLTTGNPASALPRATPVPFDQLGKMYGTTFSGWVTQQNIEASLLAGGNGTRAVIYGTDGTTGHVWNAVVQNGRINYIDGQIGASGAVNFQSFSHFQFGVLP